MSYYSAVTDANGAMSRFSYDALDRRVRWSFPSKTTAGVASETDYEEYAYDLAGNRTLLRKRDGQLLGYEYDALNRVRLKDVPGGPWGDTHYRYDNRGLQLFARFGTTSGPGVTQTYDAPGRLATSAASLGNVTPTLSYLWDANGNRTRVKHADGVNVNTSYDGLDRPRTVAVQGAGTVAT